MNLMHLKYVVEVEKTGSITQAAENLYMGQPNLSRSIKELEESLGITIFKRTAKGVIPTATGEEFIDYAKKILSEVDAVERIYKPTQDDRLKFSVSLPRASYVAFAFNNFLKRIDKTRDIEFNYKETNAMRVMKNVDTDGFNLGILRYRSAHEQHFASFLREKGLDSRDIFEFNYVLLMSERSPLAQVGDISPDILRDYIEILHGDPYVPAMSVTEAKKSEFSGITNKNIFIYERGSQFEMLDSLKESYMWVSPMPPETLQRFNLVQRRCVGFTKAYKDVLIYKKNYRFTDLDKMFLEEVDKAIAHVSVL